MRESEDLDAVRMDLDAEGASQCNPPLRLGPLPLALCPALAHPCRPLGTRHTKYFPYFELPTLLYSASRGAGALDPLTRRPATPLPSFSCHLRGVAV